MCHLIMGMWTMTLTFYIRNLACVYDILNFFSITDVCYFVDATSPTNFVHAHAQTRWARAPAWSVSTIDPLCYFVYFLPQETNRGQ